MPKVETSPTMGDEFREMISNVSNKIGNIHFTKIYSEIKLRNKRDVFSIKDADVIIPHDQNKRRVVKKLIRVQPLSNQPLDVLKNNIESSTEANKIDLTTRRARRRLKIKKKKRRLIYNDDNQNDESEEHLQQATKQRRKIVITRKRILPNSAKTSSPLTPNNIAASHVQDKILSSDEIQTFNNSMKSSSVEDTAERSMVNNFRPLPYANDENSTENLIDNDVAAKEINDTEQNTESNQNIDADSTENQVDDENLTEETIVDYSEDYIEEEEDDDDDDDDDVDEEEEEGQATFQNIPEYEPSFPELSEPLESPLLLLKTTVLSSIETLTKTITQSRLRTYTFVVTRVSGDEQIVTSTTEVKPHVKTSVITEPVTIFTTLTLLDFDATETITEPQNTLTDTMDDSQSPLLNQDNVKTFNEEARYNLATRIMSNGVEVIVAGDKSTLPGNPDFKRVLTSNAQKHVTLKPSTLTDHMVMMLPQDSTNVDSLTSSLYPNQFITKTCLTTFTYLTTYLEGSTTTVSSHEQVVSNIATEERNTGKILPTPAVGITLTQYPNLSVDVFHTTYTYLNTILDGEQPLVLSSEHTVTNTVTAPDDYLSLLKPSETRSALKNTNTYFSTINLEKTLYEGEKTSVISTKEVVTQVVITESIPPRATSVMTSYIALDKEENPVTTYSTTDVVKTYFVTYTYYNTLVENGTLSVHTNVSTSSDVVTEKLYIQPKNTVFNTKAIKDEKKKQKIDTSLEKFQIVAAKSYFTTFTYFITLLQDNKQTPTIISTSTKVVENIVTETLDPSILDPKYLKVIRHDIGDGSDTVIKVATLQNGQKIEVTAIASENKDSIKPTKVLPIEKTEMPENLMTNKKLTTELSSSPSIITGSTIVYVDDDPFAQLAATPVLSSKTLVSSTALQNKLGSLLSSEVIKNTKISTSKSKRATKIKNKTQSKGVSPTKTKENILQSSSTKSTSPSKLKSQSEKNKQTNTNKIVRPSDPSSDLLGLGSININSLQALTPVLNAMAGLITTNLKSNRRSDVNITSSTTTTTPKPVVNQKIDDHLDSDIQNRSPIYIPVGGFNDDFEIAESQNIASFDWVDPPRNGQIIGKTAQETSLLNGGIPISPGDIITANSDVIVGKPGRIGPRLPSIPLDRGNAGDEIPIGMKPPPVPNKSILKNRHEYKHIPIKSNELSNVIHAPNKDDYIGPPPPPPVIKSFRDDKRKHIPLSPPRTNPKPYYDLNEIVPHHQVYAQSQTNYDPNHIVTNINQENNYYNLQESILKNYESAAEHSYPVYARDHVKPLKVPGNPINDFNIAPSVINEPIVFPEIIERSTGQPLLVNIQPSQVAFVNIPFNRTTALIYGGSTEPHRNGQYFDDPSPYPEPEFSGIEFNDGIPHVASVYQNQSPNQKQVNGIIKVGSQFINVEPEVSANQKIPININPSKPQVTVGSDQEISINVPPISFGVYQHDNDFNAHVINHGNIQFRLPAAPYDVINREPDVIEPNHIPVSHATLPESNNNEDYVLSNEVPLQTAGPARRPQNHSYRLEYNTKPNDIPNEVYNRSPEEIFTKPAPNKSKYPFPPKRNMLRPKLSKPKIAVADLAEYMTPPPVGKNTLTRPYIRRPQNNRPKPIPLSPTPNKIYTEPIALNPPIYNSQNQKIPVRNEDDNFIPVPNNYPVFNEENGNQDSNPSYPNFDSEIGYHKEDDVENDDGEVIQESNSRPLLPGEIPIEILKAKATTTKSPISTSQRNIIRFPSAEYADNYRNDYKPVISVHAKPFTPPSIPIRQFNIHQNDAVNTKYTSTNTPLEIKNYNFHKQRYTSTETPFKESYYNVNKYNSSTQSQSNKPNGFVVVGNQFESNGGPNQIFVSGAQFANVQTNRFNGVKNNNTNSVYRMQPAPTVISTTYEANIKNNTGNVYDSQTERTIPVRRPSISTTKKPVLIYIDGNGKEYNDFFHKKPNQNNKNERPAVTSLPIDTLIVSQAPQRTSTQKYDAQTEKPFIPDQNPSLSSNQIVIRDDITTKRTTVALITTTRTYPTVVNNQSDLNIGEITFSYDNTTMSDLEIMKPPPLSNAFPIEEPNTEMQPPKPDNEKPSADIFQVPNTQTEVPFNVQSISSSDSLQEFLRPVKTTNEVLGMSPPPLITTPKSSQIITNKNIVKDIPYIRSTTSMSTESTTTRKRRPYSRRPGNYRTSTIPPTTTSIRRKPLYPLYNATNRNTTKHQTTITPTPTMKSHPSMEVIIGNPDLFSKDKNETVTDEPSENKVIEITSSELVTPESTTEKTVILNNDQLDTTTVESSISSINTAMLSETNNAKYAVSKGVHHSGNEIKIIDDLTTTTKPTSFTTKETKTTLPTRYITYTKTATVTITKTTIVKTLGMPPSTMTILVTKTEKTTIVDTVTQVHTLVKPTNIVETITTTVHEGSSLYPPEVYGSSYPSIQVQPSTTSSMPDLRVTTTNIGETPEDYEDNLEDFIIAETDPPIISNEKEDESVGNDSIFVVMTDKNTKNIINNIDTKLETQERDEMIATNEVNNINLAGILIANQPSDVVSDKCLPECMPARNELCHKVEGIMRCICRPGFARMFPDRPCLPTYTYDIKINLERIGKDSLHFYNDLKDSNSSEYIKFAQAIHDALDRMVMQSDLRDIFHGVDVHAFEPGPDEKGIVSKFYLQLSDNIEESRLEDVFNRYLRNNSYSLGGTDIFAATTNDLKAEDFDECSHHKFHDCSESAQCFNLKGTYTCSCKEGFADLSENMLYPGRICSAEQIGCERCSYHGTCYSRGSEEVLCECFQWYTGESCHINLKVLLIALVTLGFVLLALLLVCVILTCVRRKPRNITMASGLSFLPQRVSHSSNMGTMDRRAMIQDTSSEDSRSDTNTLPYVQKQKKPKGALKKTSKVSHQLNKDIENGNNTLSFQDQKDRSLTVMIPRAKYHPTPTTSPLMNYTSFDARKPSVPSIANEAKLLSYLDAGPSPNKAEGQRKISNTPNETFMDEKPGSRKTSGALVSAGFEVSATVGNNMGTLATTCGTEADRSENATLIQKISAADLLSSTGTRSQFNTLRKSLVDEDVVTSSNWLDMVPRVMTVSEARSYDETTIPPPMKSFRTDYDSKHSSQHQNDEANTMAERDLGSTFLLPHTHLYKPDRGSDISGFESL